jgi:hypothetical protein
MLGSGSLPVIGVFLALALFTMGFVYGPLGAWLPGLFPARVRYTGASMAFNLGGILGGIFVLHGVAEGFDAATQRRRYPSDTTRAEQQNDDDQNDDQLCYSELWHGVLQMYCDIIAIILYNMRMSTPRNGLIYRMGTFGCLEPREFGCLDQPIATHLHA